MKTLALLPVLAIAVSCGGSSSPDATAANAAPAPTAATPVSNALPSNEDIISKAYDSSYFVPDNFFVDERAATETRSYTVHHVLDDSQSYEVCSDDMVEATAWEEADNASRAVSGALVSIHETDRYFEFVRELAYNDDVGNVDDITSPGYGRVFKCSHTDRAGVDRNLLSGFSGVRNAQPMTADDLRDFTEYLWQFRFFNARRKVVIDSYGELSAGSRMHTLLLALVHSQGANPCDRVELVKWEFAADSQTGQVSRSYQTVRQFEAQVLGGVPQLCD